VRDALAFYKSGPRKKCPLGQPDGFDKVRGCNCEQSLVFALITAEAARLGEGASEMPAVEQCRAYATQHKNSWRQSEKSDRQRTLLLSISRCWTALANQLESLALVVKSEGK
jgi:hypothetical protein